MNEERRERVNVVDALVVAKITKCFGVRGYVKVQPRTQTLRRLKNGRQVFLGTSLPEPHAYHIEDVIVRDRSVLIKFDGIDDRTSAESVVGKYMFTDGERIPEPPKGTYFIHQIIGCDVWSTEGKFLGVIEDVLKLPAQHIWILRRGGRQYMIPAVRQFVREVNIQERKILVNLIDGLIEE